MYDLDNVDRLYTFEVAKTREEQENVTASTGFKVASHLLTHPSSINERPDHDRSNHSPPSAG